MEGIEESGWWTCPDGDEFPSREDAIEHLRMVDVEDADEGRIRPILWGPWETVSLSASSDA